VKNSCINPPEITFDDFYEAICTANSSRIVVGKDLFSVSELTGIHVDDVYKALQKKFRDYDLPPKYFPEFDFQEKVNMANIRININNFIVNQLSGDWDGNIDSVESFFTEPEEDIFQECFSERDVEVAARQLISQALAKKRGIQKEALFGQIITQARKNRAKFGAGN